MNEGIAIVGLSGRFPGADNIAQFWENLCASRESIAKFTDEQLLAAGVSANEFNDPAYVRSRAILNRPEWFDAEFFGLPPREAEFMDPQQRIFLECCWEALEDAGYDPQAIGRSAGVFASASLNTYWLRQVLASQQGIVDFTKVFQAEGYNILLGADKDYLATRVAFKLNLHGPALTLQTACSSSLVAIAQACSSLQSYQCDHALAGGVSISFPQERGHFYQEGAIPSADGSCRAFDAAARGTVFGAGCGVVLLKRLEDALKVGDHVYAVIRATALNNDGARKISYSAPSQDGQAEAISLAHALAGVTADTISYVEAHGTGTPLGDPIEVAALTQAFRATTDKTGFCGLGSLKTNVGHLEAAAGVTGVIKTALALKHRFLPATLHFKTPNPNIDFASSPFDVVAQARAWENVPLPRRAGVSSFGVGGTNAHIVLEETPQIEPSGLSRKNQLILLSARTKTALNAMAANLATALESKPELNLPDVAFTLQIGRKAFNHRQALVAADLTEAVVKLRTATHKSVVPGQASDNEPKIVFLFPGQGAQNVDMGRGLYESEPVFRAEIDLCAGILEQHLKVDLRSVLYPEPIGRAEAERQINETWLTQPAIFVFEYALARLWLFWGIKPSVLIGHSIGEYVCAVLAGTFTLEDALSLIAVRARLMQALPAGSMLAVRLPASDLTALLPAGISVAANNSAKLCTLSGPTALLTAFQKTLEVKKVASRFLCTSHAFHSAMMDPILADFTKATETTARGAPKIPWLSTCTGTWMTDEDVADAAYWTHQLRHTVLFADALDKIAGDPSYVLLEIGPGQTLNQLARQHPNRAKEQAVISSQPPTPKADEDVATMLGALGQLWICGVTPDWQQFYLEERRHRISLPGYPFERTRHWAEPIASAPVTPIASSTEKPLSLTSASRDETEMMNATSEAPAGLPDNLLLESVIQQQLATMRKQLDLLNE